MSDVKPSTGILKDVDKNVFSPQHYGGNENPFEVYKVLEAWGMDKDFYLGNVIKYVARHDRKENSLEDLKKALWYLERRIETLSNV